jgi:hypothetical protein
MKTSFNLEKKKTTEIAGNEEKKLVDVSNQQLLISDDQALKISASVPI